MRRVSQPKQAGAPPQGAPAPIEAADKAEPNDSPAGCSPEAKMRRVSQPKQAGAPPQGAPAPIEAADKAEENDSPAGIDSRARVEKTGTRNRKKGE